MMTIKRAIPAERRSIVRAFINSENERDKERAQEMCRYYGLDYQEERRRIMAEMVEQSKEVKP
jgi:hypothetical protein